MAPIEKDDLYKIRVASWKAFKKSILGELQSSITPFINDSRKYVRAFQPFFRPEKTAAITQTMHYSREKFTSFLSSWMEELRIMTKAECSEAQKQAYLNDIYERIPSDAKTKISLLINLARATSKDQVLFQERLFKFVGQRRDIPYQAPDEKSAENTPKDNKIQPPQNRPRSSHFWRDAAIGAGVAVAANVVYKAYFRA